jgi:hypothetical protein
MSAKTPHLTLAELAAGDSSGFLAAATAVHLETCAACQARSRDLAADGVRFLVSRCEPPAGLVGRVFAAIDAQPAHPRRGGLAGLGRVAGRATGGMASSRWQAAAWPWRIAAAGLAAAAVAGFIAAQVVAPGGARPAGMITVHELAYRAAAAAVRQPRVRAGQWVFWHEKQAADVGCSHCLTGTFDVWTTADSQHAAWVYKGKVVSLGTGPFYGQPEPFVVPHGGWSATEVTWQSPISYADLGSLPRDPRALVRYLGHLKLPGQDPAPVREFQVIQDLLTSYVMPPRLTAELYLALADISGVTVDPHAVDVAGRHGAGFRMAVPPGEGGGLTEIIIDPVTFHLLGTALIATAPARDFGKVVNGTAILRMALVSGPGVRP